MHGDESDAAVAQIGDSTGHRFWNIEELQICKDAFVAVDEPVNEFKVAAAHCELEPYFVESGAWPELLHQRARFRRIRHVERDDQPLAPRNVNHADPLIRGS